MSTPSKQQLQQKYKISNGDFQILTELPSEHEVREKGFLVKVGESFGAQEWMWRTWAGVILAIIVIAPQLQSDLDYWRPKIVYSVNRFCDYFRHLRWPLEPGDHDWVAFAPDASLPPGRPDNPSMRNLSIGSGLFPGSAPVSAPVPNLFVSQIRYHFRENYPDAVPGEKRVSAPATEREMLPLSQLVSSDRGIARIVEGGVAHLPYRFRVSACNSDLTVEVYHGDRPLEGFPQTVRHPLTEHWDSRIDFMIPVDDRLKDQVEKAILGDGCFLTYVNIVIGADDDLVRSAILRPYVGV